MNCWEYLDRLQQGLDGMPPSDAGDAEAHLRACPVCAAQAAAARRLADGLRLLKRPEVPAGLTAAVVTAVRRDARRRTLLRRGAYAAVALAASLLLVLGLRLPQRSADTTAPGPDLVVRPAPVAPSTAPSPPPLRDTVAEAGEAVASLTSRTADEAVDQTRLLLPIVKGPSLADLVVVPPSDAPARPLREAGEGVSAGLGPVASSARRAVDLFLRDLPPVGGQGRGGL